MATARAIQEALALSDRDDELCDRIARHLGEGLQSGEPALAIVTECRRSVLMSRMQGLGVHVADALETGRFVVLDVRAMLASIAADGAPSREKFLEHVGGVVDGMLARAARIRVYNEATELLWQVGDRHSALRLEELWSELASSRAIAMLSAHVVPPDVLRALREAEELVALLGHDLRNPLGTLTMGASYIARVAGDDKIVRAAERMLAGADRMSRMIDQLVDVTRIRVHGTLDVVPVPSDLAELCARVQARLDASGEAIAVAVHGDAIGRWDTARLQQAIETVIDNALANGSGRCAVDVDGRDPAGVAVTVRNAGAIADEILPVLFEALRGAGKRAHTTGLGLGLFIAKQIVRAHGGTIEANSSPAEGTTLRIALPRSC